MYERWDGRARNVMKLARQEAKGFNHEYIGTEHILLGLVKEDRGVAANVLKSHAIDLRKIRSEVEKVTQPGSDVVTMGKLPLTPVLKKVIEHATEEARSLNHNCVRTEHLLLGLLLEAENGRVCVGGEILVNLGLKLDDVRQEVLNVGNSSERSKTDFESVYPEPSPADAERAAPDSSEAIFRDISPPVFAIAWDPQLISDEEYAELVEIIGDLARANGGSGVRRLVAEDLGVLGAEVLQP